MVLWEMQPIVHVDVCGFWLLPSFYNFLTYCEAIIFIIWREERLKNGCPETLFPLYILA